MYDYGFPRFKKQREVYEEVEIDENAYSLYKGWNHGDPEKMSADVMETLASAKKQRVINKELLRGYSRTFPAKFFTIRSFYVCLLICGYGILFRKFRWKNMFSVLYEGIMLMLLYFYLYYQGRYLYNRVDVGIWFAVSLVLLWNWCPEKKKGTEKVGLVLALTACVMFPGKWTARLRWNANSYHPKMRELIETIHEDKEHLYLAKTGMVSFAKAYGVFDVIPQEIGNNLYSLGGWNAMTPVYQSVLEQYQIQNPFRDMIGNEQVYLLDDDIEETLQYLQTYYEEDAYAVEIRNLGKKAVYQIRSA